MYHFLTGRQELLCTYATTKIISILLFYKLFSTSDTVLSLSLPLPLKLELVPAFLYSF